MNALAVIKHIGVVPMSIEVKNEMPSGSELRRWFANKAVVINGTTPKATDEIEFPITQLVFFPKGKRKTTVL